MRKKFQINKNILRNHKTFKHKTAVWRRTTLTPTLHNPRTRRRRTNSGTHFRGGFEHTMYLKPPFKPRAFELSDERTELDWYGTVEKGCQK